MSKQVPIEHQSTFADPCAGLPEIPDEAWVCLMMAEDRWELAMGFYEVDSPSEEENQKADREKFGELLDFDEKLGAEVLIMNKAKYLSAVTGIHAGICISWTYRSETNCLKHMAEAGDANLPSDLAPIIHNAYKMHINIYQTHFASDDLVLYPEDQAPASRVLH